MGRSFLMFPSLMLFCGGVFVLILLGAGCTRDTLSIVDDRDDAIPADEASAFSGLDGSLTEFAFDAVAEGFSTYLLEEPITENPTQGIFEGWIVLQNNLPVNDTFENPIKVHSSQTRTYRLWTEGEDGAEGTGDDYFKTYRY